LSIRLASSTAPRKARVASKPAKPQPMMRTCGRVGGLTSASQKTQHDADADGRSYNLPGVVMDIVVGRLYRRISPMDGGGLCVGQGGLGLLQPVLDVVTNVGNTLRRFAGCDAELLLGIADNHLQVGNEPVILRSCCF
jgi:hypothetical protein